MGQLLRSNPVGCAGSTWVRIGPLVICALVSVPLAVLAKKSLSLDVLLYQILDLV